jgi:hypothetical protein
MPSRIKTTIVATLSEDNQYSVLSVVKISLGPVEGEDYAPSSPYALTWTALTETRNTQSARLKVHGLETSQKPNTNWAAVRSEATEMASLNQ